MILNCIDRRNGDTESGKPKLLQSEIEPDEAPELMSSLHPPMHFYGAYVH